MGHYSDYGIICYQTAEIQAMLISLTSQIATTLTTSYTAQNDAPVGEQISVTDGNRSARRAEPVVTNNLGTANENDRQGQVRYDENSPWVGHPKRARRYWHSGKARLHHRAVRMCYRRRLSWRLAECRVMVESHQRRRSKLQRWVLIKAMAV